ncbi:MAG: response regulator [Candidatus Tectomicrobia bacterium]|nr:response regulator [Candidatus Tectomicrobia bacterium]
MANAQTLIAEMEKKVQEMEQEIRLLQTMILGISEAKDGYGALSVALQKVGNFTGWVYGEAWIPRPDGTFLEQSPAWYSRVAGLEKFRALSEGFTFPPGIGLPGRVWSSKQPAWVPDITLDTNYLRASIARDVGLKAGVAIPALAGDEVVAVLVFYMLEAREENERLVRLVSAVAAQLGSVIQSKRVEEALRESEVMAQRLFESAPDALVVVNPKGRIVRINTQAEQMFGYSRDELLDKLIEVLIPEHFRERHMEQRAGYIAHPHIRPLGMGLELYGKRKEGRSFPVDVMLGPLETAEGVFVLCTIRDITERKRVEEELRQAKEEAEAANRAKSEFLANVSHEVRTPMNGIIGMMELLRNTHLTTQQREYLNMVKESADSLLRVINDILDFSKIEAGRLELESTEFNLREMLGNTTKVLSVSANLKGLDLLCHISPRVPDMLVGDHGRLFQVIINLVNNAIKFTERGKIVVSVEVESKTNNDICLHFTVSDTGIGIPPDKQQLIFEPFIQADTSTRRRYGGTGLGLAISKQFVEMMGGKIDLKSKVGKGSQFHFTTRFGVGNGVTRLPLTTTVEKGAAPAPQHLLPASRRLHILLAEDNVINQAVATGILESAGHAVAVAKNGREVLAALEREPFDLILMDVQMPEMDGFEATEAIREKERATGTHIPIVAMTARAMRSDQERCLEAGMDGYLSKPIRPGELMRAIATSALGVAEPPTESETAIVKEISSSGVVFDLNAVLARFSGNVRILTGIAQMFLDDAPQMLSTVQEAIARQDSKALEQAAHTLKGAMSHFSVPSADNAALRLEEIGESGDLSAADAAFAALEYEIDRLTRELSEFMERAKE